MSDEELLIMYQKYKRKRMIIIAVILIFILLMSLYLYFHFNNTSSPEVEKIKEEVIVKDEVAPIIKLKVNNIEITKGDDISYLDYIESVIDDKDGDLLDKVKYQEIDTSIIGEQSIIYSASDNSGNSSQEILSVLIKEKILENNNGSSSNNSPMPDKEKPSIPSNNNSSNKETNKPKDPVQNEKPIIENKPSTKIVKYFLFSDGYTMVNVAEACANELKKTNQTGMCSPIQDENGIYLGMKLETE